MTRTNAYTILCVLIRAFALALFVRIAGNAFGISVWMDGTEAPMLPFVIATLVPVAITVSLWLFADVFARLALARPTQLVFDSDLPAAEWQRLAFSAIGLWFAFSGLMDLVYVATGALIAGSSDGHGGMRFDPVMVDLVTSVIELAAGVALMFGARGLVGMLRRFRQFGNAAPSRPADSDPSAD